MSSSRSQPVWRWVAAAAVVLNAAHNLFAEKLHSPLPSVGEVSARYGTLFTPAPYAFAIWGLIYLSFLAYSAFSLSAGQRAVSVHDTLAKGLVVYSVLGIAWVELFIRQQIGASLLVIFAMGATGATLFLRALRAESTGGLPARARWPFSLFFGWISVAILANCSVWLKVHSWTGGPGGEVAWTLVMIAVAVLLALGVGWRYRDQIYPGVILWSMIAIGVARNGDHRVVALTALAGAVAIAAEMTARGVRRRTRPAPAVRRAFGRRHATR